MGFALPNGSTVFVGSGLGSPVSVSTVSNAEGAVFTVAENHNLKVDDVVLISSGWGVIDGLVARITAQTTPCASGSYVSFRYSASRFCTVFSSYVATGKRGRMLPYLVGPKVPCALITL